MELKEIYSDDRGKIKAGKDELTGSIVLKVEYLDLNPESITFPNDAIDKMVVFLGNSRNESNDSEDVSEMVKCRHPYSKCRFMIGSAKKYRKPPSERVCGVADPDTVCKPTKDAQVHPSPV